MERATGIEPVLPTWECKLSTLYFQHLQNRSAKIYVHALHTVHAVPDLRIAAGRLRDGFLSCVAVRDCGFEPLFCLEASRYLSSVMISYLGAKTSTASINPGMPCLAMLTNLLRKERTCTSHAMHCEAGFVHGCGTFAG